MVLAKKEFENPEIVMEIHQNILASKGSSWMSGCLSENIFREEKASSMIWGVFSVPPSSQLIQTQSTWEPQQHTQTQLTMIWLKV